MTSTLSKVELAQKIKELEDFKRYNRLEYFCRKKKFHKWQLDFFKASADYTQRFALCGNRTGKTFSGMAEIAIHATGKYPIWWVGRRFKRPPKIVICGKSNESMRDTTFELLVGDLVPSAKTGTKYEVNGEGWFVKSDIEHLEMASGVKKFAKEMRVKHTNGISKIYFRAYSQGHMALAGLTLDIVAIDEEPEFDSIGFVAQAMTRLFTTRGMLLILATPEHGLTELVDKFMNYREEHQYLANIGWDDCEHITEQMIKELLDSIPEYQHKMRRSGLPVFSEGLVYCEAESNFVIEPIAIPAHWEKCGAMDLGFTHPTTFIQSAWDRENDIVYVYSEYGAATKTPMEHTMNILTRVGRMFPIVLPHDARNVGRDGAEPMKKQYEDLGLNIVNIFENPVELGGGNNVEIGLLEILQRMKTGRLKIFNNCAGILAEIRKYRRSPKDGKPIKEEDDYMDGMRYSVMSLLGGKGERGDPKKMNAHNQIIESYHPRIF